MKKNKSLIILLGILAVLVCVYFVAVQIQKKNAEKETGESGISVLELSELTSIEYSSKSGSMAFVKEDGVWYSTDDKEFPLKQSELESIESAFRNVQAVRELKDGDTLADYGLEDSEYVILVEDSDGNSHTLFIGDAAGEDYYMTLDDKEKIYTVESSMVDVMNFDLDSMVQMETFPVIGTDNIKTVSIANGGETTTYDSENNDQSEDITAIGGGLGAAYFVDCLDYNIQEGELAQYGLDEAERTTVTVVYTDSNDEEQTFVLYIGAADDTDTYNYVLMDGSTMVYTMTQEIVDNILNVETESE